ncbi:hypothetical protein LO762_00455 [Actinocorallia sp. API 0066]|uniref:hypothetical protein n=1 Tax=Actinocorallia sp. API 0066 TaxID=2896846 RepID=UPI001E4FC1BB|nr:hypothetical protein [Actinocorallia sp. API 0066]MCD0447674.1 hypothetical protein [Actinocorallia sp. API 0066]
MIGRESLPPELETVWQAEADRPASLQGKGVWVPGGAAKGTVVRVRSDGALSYRIADGAKTWRYDTGGGVVCMMSATAPDGVGLMGTALHVADGEVAVLFNGYQAHADRMILLDVGTGGEFRSERFEGNHPGAGVEARDAPPSWLLRRDGVTLVASHGADRPLSAYRLEG